MFNMLVEHNHKVYVGDVTHDIIREMWWNTQFAPPSFMSPVYFYETACKVETDVYSNNMDFVRYYKPENVMVVKDDKIKCLTECPRYEIWKDEMDSGEMYSLFGNDWV